MACDDFAYLVQAKQNAPDLLLRPVRWAYRKAAWAIEDTPQDPGLIDRTMGRKGLESIENVGPRMAGVIEELLKVWSGSFV